MRMASNSNHSSNSASPYAIELLGITRKFGTFIAVDAFGVFHITLHYHVLDF